MISCTTCDDDEHSSAPQIFPSDVLQHIFSFCDEVSDSFCMTGVCKYWYQVSRLDHVLCVSNCFRYVKVSNMITNQPYFCANPKQSTPELLARCEEWLPYVFRFDLYAWSHSRTGEFNKTMTLVNTHCTNLQSLHLNQSNRQNNYITQFVTNALLETIVACHPQLTEINTSWCSRITDDGVMALCSLVNLSYVDLSGCRRVTDVSVVSLVAMRGGTLEVLILHGCKEISDATLSYLGGEGNGTALKVLDVSNISYSTNFTAEQVKLLQTQRPNVRIMT
eukprot:PhF_6_TR28278/c0_g1_i2/m.41848